MDAIGEGPASVAFASTALVSTTLALAVLRT
jgi:hypothetical protein